MLLPVASLHLLGSLLACLARDLSYLLFLKAVAFMKRKGALSARATVPLRATSWALFFGGLVCVVLSLFCLFVCFLSEEA